MFAFERASLLAVLIACLAGVPADGAEDWGADAIDAGLAPAEIARLENERFLISRFELKQSFSAYIGSKHHTFITSDAVLNAYHVLFEETLRQIESRNVGILKDNCEFLWKRLDHAGEGFEGDSALIQQACDHARFVIGVAVGLLGGDFSQAPEGLHSVIESEVAAVERAEGQAKPKILGEPESTFLGFDYTVFRPAGFYADTERLERYYRATRWLQLVPFRAEVPTEMLSLAIMGAALAGGEMERAENLNRQLKDMQFTWKALSLGASESGWLKFLSGDISFDPPCKVYNMIAILADYVAKETMVSTGNDRIRLAPDAGADNGEARLLPTVDLPENGVLRAGTNEDRFAGGLDVAAWLKLPLAEKILRDHVTEATLSKIQSAGSSVLEPDPFGDAGDIDDAIFDGWADISWRGGTCLAQLYALRSLDSVDPRAPDFMHEEAWKRKTLMTVAASWAQHRHAWALQGRLHILYAGLYDARKAFVEPVPEFFARLASVCEVLADLETGIDPRAVVAERLDAMVPLLRSDDINDLRVLSSYEKLLLICRLAGVKEPLWGYDGFKPSESIPTVLAIQEKLWSPDHQDEVDWSPIAAELQPNAQRKWSSLAAICLRLAYCGQKQLAGQEFNAEENRWLGTVGERLAGCMLYQGNSFLSPLDDASRIARVSSAPASGKVFHAAIGRPRVIYVVYPWKGEDYFCQGSVLPYHEVIDSTTLTDTEWRGNFQDESRSGIPPWLQELVPAEEVELQQRH